MREPLFKGRPLLGLAYLLFLALLFLAGWHLGGSNLWQEIRALQERQKNLEGELVHWQAIIEEGTSARQQWGALQEEGERLALLIPPLEELPATLETLEGVLNSGPGSLHNLQIDETGLADGSTLRLQVSIESGGRPAEMEKLLENLTSLPQPLFLEHIAWQEDSENGESRLALQGSFFFLDGGDEGLTQ